MQKHPTRNSAKGFTLIEMLIAIAIIGILAAVAIPILATSAQKTSRKRMRLN